MTKFIKMCDNYDTIEKKLFRIFILYYIFEKQDQYDVTQHYTNIGDYI